MTDNAYEGINLVPAPITILQGNMVLQADVYDSKAERLIIKRGATLRGSDINRIKYLNKNNDIIYISDDAYRKMTGKPPRSTIQTREEREESTGYAAVKDDTLLLLDEIARTNTVQQDALLSVSSDLSNTLEVVKPSMIVSLINALAPVDEYLQRHCVNVSLLNGLFGKWLGLEKKEIDRMVTIGLLHDCGKALIPTQILNAPRKLSFAEFEVIKMHTVYTYDLLTEFPEPIRFASKNHHEKIDGTGYPNSLAGENIPFVSRITAVSDIYDAMVSQRSYKAPRSPFNIMAILNELKGIELDSEIVELFISKMPLELVDKQVMMSDGSVGVVRSFDLDDIEYPEIEVDGRRFKSDKRLYCTSMYIEE